MRSQKYPMWVPVGSLGMDDFGFYKYLNSQDAPKVVGGSLLFRHLSYYVQMELSQGDTFIGDKYEGRTLNRLDSWTYDQNSSADMHRVMKGMGINNSSGGSVHYSDSTMALNYDGFIFCFSYGDHALLQEKMRTEAGYDGAVEIYSILEFVEQIYDHSYLDDVPVKSLFNVHVIEVKYGEVGPFTVTGNQDLRKPDPALKAIKYAQQNELRIMLEPIKPVPEKYRSANTIFIRMDNPETVLKIVD